MTALPNPDRQSEERSLDPLTGGGEMMYDRDYTLVVEQSAAMAAPQPDGRSLWESVRHCVAAVADKCEELNPEGITVYFFNDRFERHDNVTPDRVEDVFANFQPAGRADLAAVLRDAVRNYLLRRARGEAKANGETIAIVTEGHPTDSQGVIDAIVEASQQIDRNEELGISLIQAGSDPEVTKFLKYLDNELTQAGRALRHL